MRGALAILALALAVVGCGASDERSQRGAAQLPKGDWGPERPGTGERVRPEAPPRKAPSADVARLLAAGAVGVVGVEGVVGVRPETIDVAADATLEDVRWDRWDSTGAEGAGTLSVRDCDPSCASGGKDAYPARVRLSAPRLCRGEAYFDRARVELDAGDPPQPASYVRAPC
jgi:hypothetical protein